MRKRRQAVSHSSSNYTTSTLNGLFKEVYAKKLVDLIPNTEALMGTLDCGAKLSQETPLQYELRNLNNNISNLREAIARKREQLRIELAKLAAVKKLAKGGK